MKNRVHFTFDMKNNEKFNVAKVNQESFSQHFPFDCENEEQSNKNQNLKRQNEEQSSFCKPDF